MTERDAEAGVAGREWRLVRDDARDGSRQMALEEVAVATAIEHDLRTVRTYAWEPSTLSLGYRQEPDTVDWDFCERKGIDVTRRQTGGGGIYHDSGGDISYTIVAPAEEVPGDLMECYALFCEPILDAFSRMGIDADFASEAQPSLYEPSCYLRDINPAHDIVVSQGDGSEMKISGNAQYRRKDAVIQHGSISYDLDPERHLGVFADPGVTSEEFRDRVTSIRREVGIDREEAVRILGDALADWCGADEGDWDPAEEDVGRSLAARKYMTDAWVRERRELEPKAPGRWPEEVFEE